MTSARAIHQAEQAAALDAEVDAAMRAAFTAWDVFSTDDNHFLQQLKQHHPSEVVRANCGHQPGALTPVHWSPREPDAVRCDACYADARRGADLCDRCNVYPASHWRDVGLPRTAFELGWPVGPPVTMHIRLCDGCAGDPTSEEP